MEFKISQIAIILIIIIFFGCCKRIVNYEDDEIIKGQIVSENSSAWSIKLLYEINDEVEYVFTYWTYFAIDFIDITVDGNKLPVNFSYTIALYNPSMDYRRYELYKVEEKKQHFISMLWTRVGIEGIYWEDYTMGASAHSRGYYIPRESKILHITYRIILPYPTMTVENLFDKTYKNKIYTKEYKMYVDLEELFNSSSFLYP